MNATSPPALAQLADGEVLAGLTRLVTRDNQLTAELLDHIGEVDARRLYLPAGCTSMFTYCVRVLGLSEDAAYRRIQAARAARRYPLIFDLVATGKLHLAAVTLLAPHLSPDNHRELLTEAMCLSKRDVERLIAHHFPAPDPPSFVRRCPCSLSGMAPGAATAVPTSRTGPGTPSSAAPPVCADTEIAEAQLAPGQVGAAGLKRGEMPGRPSGSSPCPSSIGPLGPGRYQIQLAAGEQFYVKLRTAQELLGNSVLHADLAQVFERALDALLRDLRRRKYGCSGRPNNDRKRSRPPRPGTRRIPAAIRREVAARDGEQCTFVDPESGRRCDARSNLQFHHLEPWARRRRHDPAKLTLRCAAHNLYAARQDYGADFIARKLVAAGERGALAPGARASPVGSRDPPAGGAATISGSA